MTKFYRALLAFCSAVIARAELTLAPVFTDHMVLQRDQSIPVWGSASPAAQVIVEFTGNKQTVIADEKGHWLVRLPPHAAQSEPSTLRVSSATELRLLTDILVGEVWLAAGQSNMEWPLGKESHAEKEVPHATHALIRLYGPAYVGKDRGGAPFTPDEVSRLDSGNFFRGGWTACTPETAAAFSAIGYYFAKEIQAATDVPIGVINLAVGGSPAEAWIAREALATDPELRPLIDGNWLENLALEEWCRQRGHENLDATLNSGVLWNARDGGPDYPFKPGFLWLAGVEPLAPFAIRGVIWYQGESNSLRVDRVRQHEKLFPFLVSEWRRRWGIGDFPFFYCQLSGIEVKSYHSEFWPEFRDGQRRMLSIIPNSGMVVTSDVGDAASVHPRDKFTVGQRLASLALVRCYGRNLESSGPLPIRVTAHGREIIVEFDHAVGGLRTSEDQSPTGFEIAAEDGNYFPANGTVTGSVVTLTSQGLAAPRRVRYDWQPFPTGNLINALHLPVSTFALEAESNLRK